MPNQSKTFIINHTIDAINYLLSAGFHEQPPVVTTIGEESPMKIIVMLKSKRFFPVCVRHIHIAEKMAKSILGEAIKNTTLDLLREEVNNG